MKRKPGEWFGSGTILGQTHRQADHGTRRAGIRQACLLAVCGVGVAIAAIAGVWSPVPDPEFETTEITVDGIAYDGNPIEVAPGSVMTLTTWVLDDDTLTDGSTSDLHPDDGAIIWSASDGSLSANRVPTGTSVEWTAPELDEYEPYREVTITAQADDDSTEEPGDPLDGHAPNRDDTPGPVQTVVFRVAMLACNVTGAASNKATVTVGENFTLTATGTDLGTVDWDYRLSHRDPAAPIGTWTDFAGTGSPITENLTTPGRYVIRARCAGSSATTTVTVVDVDRVIKDASNPEQIAGNGVVGTAVTVRAMPNPAGATFPANQPVWTLVKPATSTIGNPAAGATAAITPDVAGTYTLTARCGTGAQKTYTLTVGGNRVEQTMIMIMRDPHVSSQRDFDEAVGGSGYPAGNAKVVSAFLVTVGFDTNALPKPIQIKVEPTRVYGSLPSPGAFPGIGAGFKDVGTIAAVTGVAKQSGGTQYTGVATNGCVVLEGPPGFSDGPGPPNYDSTANQFPNAAATYPYRAITTNGRWFKVTYAIAVAGGTPTLTVTAAQQSIAANNAGRACP